jgi:hypothetical protein
VKAVSALASCVRILMYLCEGAAFYQLCYKSSALSNFNSDREFKSWPGYEVKSLDCYSFLEAHGQWILVFQPPAAYSGDEQTSRNNNWI